MAVITSGKTFANGEQLSASKLNQVITGATFNASDAVDGSTMQLVGGAMAVADGGITKAKLATDALESAYPVGSIYMNAAVATNPGTLLGFGTWVAFGAGKVPVGIDAGDTDFDTAEETGGAKTVSLSEAELPQHHHLAAVNGSVSETGDVTSSNAISEEATQGGSTNQSYTLRPATSSTFGTVGRTSQVGSGTAHNNLQPYIVVHMWKRTA